MNHTRKIHVNKTTTTAQEFSVGLVLIATAAILTLAYATNAHAQVDCSTNPDDPSCQDSSSPSNHIICKIIVAGGAIILGHPELSPLGQVICEP